MKTQQLQVFVTVARERSLRAAARKLGLTSPGVMRTIQELEADTGVQLMTRSVRGIELTGFGHALELRANRLLQDIQRARDELTQMQGEMLGQVSFACTSAIAVVLAGRTLKRFRERAPFAQVSIAEERFPLNIRRLREGSVDFIASHVMPGEVDGDMRQIHLFDSDFVVMARKDHPLLRARKLADLKDAEWFVPASYDGANHSIMADTFAAAGLPIPERLTRYVSFSVTLGLVTEADVIGFFPRMQLDSLKLLGLRQIRLEEPLPSLQTCAIVRRDFPMTPVAHHFLDCLRACAAELSGQEKRVG